MSRDVETKNVFFVFLPASARGIVGLASARRIVVSLYLAFSLHARFLSFLFDSGLVDARIPHVVIISHLLRANDDVIAT